MKSRTCHSSAACRPKSSSMLGRRPSARSRTVRNMSSTSSLHSATAAPTGYRQRRGYSFDPAELHPQRGQHLRHVIVQLARQIFAFLFLRVDELLRQLPASGARPRRDCAVSRNRSRNTTTSATARPRSTVCHSSRSQVVAECGVPPRDLGSLRGEIRVVQLLDLLRDRQHRLAPRHDFAPQKSGAPNDLLGRRPVEQRIEGLPVVVELSSAGWRSGSSSPLASGRQLGERRHGGAAELRELLAILRRPLRARRRAGSRGRRCPKG